MRATDWKQSLHIHIAMGMLCNVLVIYLALLPLMGIKKIE